MNFGVQSERKSAAALETSIMQGVRVLAVMGAVGAGLALAGCSSSNVRTDARVARANGAENVQASAYAPVQPGEALRMAGRWILNDEFERSCVVQLDDAPIEAGKHKAYATKDCTQAMRHLRGWDVSADASSIRLYGANGRVLGQLMRGEEQRYKGSMALTTEQVVIATLRPI